MNWNSTEFIWLDWLVLTVGVIAIVWAVYRAIKKDQEKMKGADSQDYLFGKGEPWYIIGAAIFAANIGSEHLVGLAGTGAKDGVGMAHWEMQGWMILILGWLFLPEIPLHTTYWFMAVYHYTDCIRIDKGICNCIYWRYLL